MHAEKTTRQGGKKKSEPKKKDRKERREDQVILQSPATIYRASLNREVCAISVKKLRGKMCRNTGMKEGTEFEDSVEEGGKKKAGTRRKQENIHGGGKDWRSSQAVLGELDEGAKAGLLMRKSPLLGREMPTLGSSRWETKAPSKKKKKNLKPGKKGRGKNVTAPDRLAGRKAPR